MGLPNVLVVAQGKGGVGKTSLAANLAGLIAAAGRRVLVVDFDQQANLRRELGTDYDDGRALYTAVSNASRPPIIREVRDRLDMVPGGPAVADLVYVMIGRLGADDGHTPTDLITNSLATVAHDYDLVLVDTPPGERVLVEAALGAARWLIIPTAADEGSIDGLNLTAKRFANAKKINPSLQLLGVVLFGIAAQSKTIERDTRKSIAEIIGVDGIVFDARIRHQAAPAVDARRQGLLIHELEQQVAAAKSSRLARLAGRGGGQASIDLRTRDAKGLTDDYYALAQEVLDAMKASLTGATT